MTLSSRMMDATIFLCALHQIRGKRKIFSNNPLPFLKITSTTFSPVLWPIIFTTATLNHKARWPRPMAMVPRCIRRLCRLSRCSHHIRSSPSGLKIKYTIRASLMKVSITLRIERIAMLKMSQFFNRFLPRLKQKRLLFRLQSQLQGQWLKQWNNWITHWT
jgi:hypothetical protein